MAKRYFPQQYGDRKKAKLDISISDHNFPLSQNVAGPSKEPEQADTWGDDNDDEILLLASQACEDAYNNDVSSLPDYSAFLQNASTSTQLGEPPRSNTGDTGTPKAGTSNFAFKKPSVIPPNVSLSTNLKDKCNRISSPLPGISSKATKDQVNLSDDLIFNDKIFQGQDSDVVYRQLLQLQEENAKLKSENGKLLEKCVTKEGESSILRTQLKSCQSAVDNARLERIKAQEKVQMEWTEKLQAANSNMHDLRTQLDFKNLEIISIKEKVRLLESNKVKLTQVTVGHNDISSSQRRNNHSAMLNDSMLVPARRVKTSTNSIQTEKAQLLKLNKTPRSEPPPLALVLPLALERSRAPPPLARCDHLRRHSAAPAAQCRVYGPFYRMPHADHEIDARSVSVSLEGVVKDLVKIVSGDFNEQNILDILKATKTSLHEVQSELEVVSAKMTSAFQRELDERYMEATSELLVVCDRDLLSGRPLYPQEQAIVPRRLVAILQQLLRSNKAMDAFLSFEKCCKSTADDLADMVHRICQLLDSTSCALLYSGLLSSLVGFLQTTLHKELDHRKTVEIVQSIIMSRPMSFVCCHLLVVVRKLTVGGRLLDQLCRRGVAGNLRLDYDQGVLLYKTDSCGLQVLLKQVEGALKCIEKQSLCNQALEVTQNLVLLYGNVNGIPCSNGPETLKCDCYHVLQQVTVYALTICAGMIYTGPSNKSRSALLGVCRSGVQLLYQCTLRDVEFGSRLGHNEGHLIRFVEIMRTDCHGGEGYANMLSELSSTFQTSPEDTTSYGRQPWINSFQSFAITD